MTEKQIKNTQTKCKSCGGNMFFSPEEKALKCAFCSSLYKINYVYNSKKHDYVINENANKEYLQFTKQNKVFKCSSCGSNIILNSLEISKKCPYCSSDCVVDKSVKIGLKPDYIIPFEFGPKKALEIYTQALKKKKFIPNKLKKHAQIDKLSGVYVPCFCFDAFSNSSYQGRLGKTTTIVRNGKTYSKVNYFNIYGTHDMTHRDIIIETSSHLTQIEFNEIKPYKLTQLVDFKTEFISGYSLEVYNQNLKNCKKVADDIMRDIIKSAILSNYDYDIISYFNLTTNFANEKYAYYILPVYRFNYKYKNKQYTTFMNGQTGRVGLVPKSALKITLFVLSIIAIMSAIILTICLL